MEPYVNQADEIKRMLYGSIKGSFCKHEPIGGTLRKIGPGLYRCDVCGLYVGTMYARQNIKRGRIE